MKRSKGPNCTIEMSLDFRNVSSWIPSDDSKTEVVPVKFGGVAHTQKKTIKNGE